MLPSSTGAEPPPGSLSLGRWFGIDVYLEAAILLPVALIVLPIMQQIPGSMGLILGLLLFVMLFGSVLLHEFGHALMARRCGVGTRRISLGMLGGVALLDGPSPTVKGDILITIAGPLVNVVLWFLADAALGFVRQAAASGAGFHESGMPLNESLFFTGMTLDLLRDINKGLLFFNLIPAFPMDGGRLLFGLLRLKLEPLKAMLITLRVATVAAGLMLGYAVWRFTNGGGGIIMGFIAFQILSGSLLKIRSIRDALAGRNS
jgi:Zn-dependent protease